MKKIIIVLGVATSMLCAATTFAGRCGNDCDGGPEACDPCKQTGNPFSPYSGSVQREMTDLQLFGGIGEEKLAFKRITTSRYKPAIPTPLGTGGSWRHSYYWNIVPNGTDRASGNEIIHVDYPDGREQDFHKTTSTDLYLTGVSATHERIEQLSSDSNQYYLWFPDGKRISFRKVVVNNTPSFVVQGFYDRYSNFFKFNLDGKNRVNKITEPGGRYISITYGPIGNFPVGNVTFTYTNSTATSVWLAGDFNGWQAANSQMTNNNGTWSITIPLQLGASYQYKFIVDGQWVSDPNNPNTIPAGGPSTHNNSVCQNGDLNTSNGPVNITFTYNSSTATSVTVAGSFNNWNMSTNTLTRNGNTWSATVPLNQGLYQYKLVINNNDWEQDTTNPLTSPDGYGHYNSVVGVGPIDEAITQVQTSDGRYVTYNYSAYAAGPAVYSTLTQVNYATASNPAETAHYTYSNLTAGGRPTLASADDPRYEGPLTRVGYTYQSNGIEGFIASEYGLDDPSHTPVSTLAPSDTGDRSVTTAGRTLQHTFSSGHLVSSTDSLQRVTTYHYYNSGWGMPSDVTDPNHNTTHYDLTAQFGNPATTTFADTKTRIIAYMDNNKPFFISTETDENQHTTTYTRDSRGRPTRIDYADGSYEIFNYGGSPDSDFTSATDGTNVGLLYSHRLRNGKTEYFTYYGPDLSANGKPGDLFITTNAASEFTSFKYYASGQIASKTDGDSNTTSFQYSDRGLVDQITYADTSTRVFGYDTYGNRTCVTNEIFKTTNYTFDQYNRVTDISDPLQHRTHYTYGDPQSGSSCTCNFQNHPTSITLPSLKVTTIIYDTEWQKTNVTVGSGSEGATTHYDYDGNGNMIHVRDGRQNIWVYDYDNRNRNWKVTDPNGNYTSYEFDGVGNKVTEKRSGDTNSIVYAYDGSNHLTDVTDQAGNHTQMTYDGAGSMLTLKDARNNTYTFTYDGMNRKLTIVYPDSSSDKEQWAYDAAGNLHTYTARAGQVETFGYDNRNREASTTWSDGTPATSETYFANGLLKTLNSSISSLTYEYYDDNQLKSETQQIAADSGPKTVTYTYTPDHKHSSIVYPSGSTVSIGYSSRNQVNSISTNGISATYTYDKSGNRDGKTLGNGTTTAYMFDIANRLTQVDHQKNGTSFANYDYGYNTVNNRTNRTETIGGVAKVDAYSYDAIDQIKSVKYNFNQGSNTQDRLVGYNYDAAGNRADGRGVFGVTDSVNGNTSYQPNNLNQYTTAGSLSPTYNSNGNLQSQGGWSYTYDAMNRLTLAYNAGSNTTVTCAYDGRNRCVSRTVNNVTTFFYYDAWKLLEERDSADAVQARYIHGSSVDDLVARVAGASIYYFHQDALGSAVALTNSSGNPSERYSYDVFGAPTLKDGNGNTVGTSSSGNRFLFTGREHIQSISLYDYRNRIYSPGLGRFLQTDPLRFQRKEKNLYRYGFNDPILLMDPFGLDAGHCVCQADGTWKYQDDHQYSAPPARSDFGPGLAGCLNYVRAETTYYSGRQCGKCDDRGGVIVDQDCINNNEKQLGEYYVPACYEDPN
jgi:RHS repeat-associated protein